MNFKQLLIHIAADLGIPSEQYVRDGGLTFDYENRLELHIESNEDNDHFANIHTVLGEDSKDKGDDLYKQLMESHLFGFETQGSVFGISKKRGKVYLFNTLNLINLKYDDFITQLETFVSIVDNWHLRFINYQSEQKRASEPITPPKGYIDVNLLMLRV